MFALFRSEMSKQWRRPRTYIALGFTMLIPVIVTIALKANPPSLHERDANDAFFYFATKTGLYLPVAALRVMSRFLLVIVVALFAGDAVASEASWGNLRAMLVRPISRGRLLFVKLIVAALLALLATALISIAGLVAGGIAFGWHPIDANTFGGINSFFLAGFHQSTAHWIGNLGVATLYVFWSLSSVIAFGFMVSTMTDSPVGATFAAFGFYVFSQILDGISAIGTIRNGFPTHYLDAWQDLFTPQGAGSNMVRGALLPIAYVLVFCGIGWWWFRRKDILS
jgi:ABC-2 type transport system permease protein